MITLLVDIIIALLMAASLYAGNNITDAQQNIIASENAIKEYEQAGDYSAALKIARNGYEESLDNGLIQVAENFSLAVKRIEEELLTLGSSRLLFDENNQPRVKLLKLLEHAGMAPLNNLEKAIVQINDWAQKNLLRKGERWEEQTSVFEALKPQIKPLLKDLGFINGSSAHFNVYQGAIVHGALLSSVRLRIHYLVEQWKQGVKFSHIYFLSGARPLEEQLENKEKLLHEESPLKIKENWPVKSGP